MQTTCESCLFSIKEEGKQTGCKFNRLDKFEKELIDDRFYILDGYCNSCRNVNWYYKADHPDATEEELIEQCKKEISLSYNFFILHLAGDSIEDVIESIKFLESTKVKPKYIYILTTLDINKAKQLYIDIMPHTSINVKIDISEDVEADEDILIRRGFDIASHYQYTAIARPTFNKRHDTIYYFNEDYILEEGKSFYIINFNNFWGNDAYPNYYVVDTQTAKHLLFHDIESKDLKTKMLSVFSSYEDGAFNV